MFSSNQQKQRAFVKDRRIKEEVEYDQQEKLDAILDKEAGIDEYSSNLADLSKRVGRKLSTNTQQFDTKYSLEQNARKMLNDAINNNNLTELFNKMKKIKDNVLTSRQIIIRDDLSNSTNRDVINQLIQEALPGGVDAIKQTVLESLGGIGGEKDVLDMISKTSTVENLNAKLNPRTKVDRIKEKRETKKKMTEDVDAVDMVKEEKEKEEKEKEEKEEKEKEEKKNKQIQKDIKSVNKARADGEKLLREANIVSSEQSRRQKINNAKKKFKDANKKIIEKELPMELYNPFN
jgi:hypothetical protein